jgi:hypothetical protein
MMSKVNFGMSKSKYSGSFTPKNPKKYIGTFPIIYRSSWEHKMCMLLDSHPNVLEWASETIAIPYINPFSKKKSKVSNYYPDFYVMMVDKTGKRVIEIIEIKPAKETFMERAKSQRDKLCVVQNHQKWTAAKQYCEQQGYTFRVLTELDIWGKK